MDDRQFIEEVFNCAEDAFRGLVNLRDEHLRAELATILYAHLKRILGEREKTDG